MLNKLKNFYRGKQVLITGNTGFKGSWLSIWLTILGAKVIGYSLNPPTKPNIFEICRLKNKIKTIIGDVRYFNSLKEVFKIYKPDIVFHMAAQSLVRYSYKNPRETYSTNVMGTVNLLEVCRSTPSVRVIVNVTSDKCYEYKKHVLGYMESDPMGGYDPYSSSKGCAELITNAYLRSFFNFDKYEECRIVLASVRAGNVIGGGDWAEDRLIPDCVRYLLQKKTIIVRHPDAIRPWQHVLEPLYGYLLLSQRLYENGSEFNGAWNFGPNAENFKPVRWLVKRIVKSWGNDASWKVDKADHPFEVDCLKLNSSKAKSRLKWYPKWHISLALEKTIEWYKGYFNKGDMFEVTLEQIKDYEGNL